VTLLAAVAFAWAGLAAAQTRQQASMQQRADAQQRAQNRQNVSQQQLSNKLRDNRISEQQRQNISDNARRPYTNDAATTHQINQADQAQHDHYQNHQQDALKSYESAVTPQPTGKRPAHGSSSGG
jgi:hypothetical protein